MKAKPIYKIYRVLGLILLFWSITIVSIFLITAIRLGYSPLKIEDSKDLNYWLLDVLSNGSFVISFFISMFCSMLFIILFLVHMILDLIKQVKPNYKSILLSSIGLFIYILMLFVPRLNNIIFWLWD